MKSERATAESKFTKTGAGASALIFGILLTTTSAHAQVAGSGGATAAAQPQAEPDSNGNQLTDIVVTARKRSESVQRVPGAVTALSGDQLRAGDVQGVMDLSSVAPNFSAPRNTVSFSAPQFYMRGVGRADNNWNTENAVAVFVDDVYLQSTAGAYIDMIDFDRVEVLRGPQGTLYGRNATTGAIKFVPRLPELERTRVIGEVAVGSHNRNDLKIGVSTPLIEGKLGVKLDLYRTANDGFLTRVDTSNRTLDPDFAKQEHLGGRLAFLWKPAEGLQFELNFDATKQNNGTNLLTPIVPDNPSDITQLLSKRGTVNFKPLYGVSRAATEPLTGNGGAKFESYGIVFKATYDTSFGTFKSITGWRQYKDTFLSQLGGTGLPSTIFGVSLYSTVDSLNRFKQFTEELQFSGSIGSRIKFVTGAYYFNNPWFQRQYGSIIGVPSDFSPVLHPGYNRSFGGTYDVTDQSSRSFALYIDGSWEILPGVSILAGARQTWDRKRVSYDALFEDDQTRYPGFPVYPERKYSRFTPKLGLQWQAKPDILLYASYAEGYKAGNLEGDRASDPAPAMRFLDPEVVKTYEIGFKSEFLDHRVRLNVAAFTSDYSNKADLVSPETVAIADERIRGVEVELNVLPTRGLRLFGNLGLLDAKYTAADPGHPIFTPDPTGFVLGLNAEPIMAPKYSLTVGASYDVELRDGSSINATASMEAVGKHYNGVGVANYDSEIVKPYQVVDASISYRLKSPNLTLSVGVNNLTNETYWTTGIFGSVPEFAGRYYADKRNWYAKARIEF